MFKDTRFADQQVKQLGEVNRQSPRLVLGPQIGGRAPAGLILELEIGKLQSVLVTDDEADIVHLVDRPRRRETAGRHDGGPQLLGN